MPTRRSEQVDARERLLEEVEKEFSRHVIHELKTPLALLHGYATTLIERELPDEQRRWFLQVIADQSLRMSEGIERLGELRRLGRTARRETADVRAAVREAVRRLEEAAPGLGLELSGDGEPLMVRGTGRWLVRAFEEVLAAAAAASDAVRVRVRRGPAVTVTVTPSGGMRLSSLGLYLARRIAEHFGGSVSLRPARVTIRLLPVKR